MRLAIQCEAMERLDLSLSELTIKSRLIWPLFMPSLKMSSNPSSITTIVGVMLSTQNKDSCFHQFCFFSSVVAKPYVQLQLLA